LVNFEGIVMELERNHLIGELDSLCSEVDALHDIAQSIIGIFRVTAYIKKLVH
jgi:hypothetical protein